MTGGQTALSLGEAEDGQDAGTEIRRLDPGRSPLAVPEADEEELNAHRAFLDGMAAKTNVLWDEQGIS